MCRHARITVIHLMLAAWTVCRRSTIRESLLPHCATMYISSCVDTQRGCQRQCSVIRWESWYVRLLDPDVGDLVQMHESPSNVTDTPPWMNPAILSQIKAPIPSSDLFRTANRKTSIIYFDSDEAGDD